jgi:hypothetical protein
MIRGGRTRAEGKVRNKGNVLRTGCSIAGFIKMQSEDRLNPSNATRLSPILLFLLVLLIYAHRLSSA